MQPNAELAATSCRHEVEWRAEASRGYAQRLWGELDTLRGRAATFADLRQGRASRRGGCPNEGRLDSVVASGSTAARRLPRLVRYARFHGPGVASMSPEDAEVSVTRGRQMWSKATSGDFAYRETIKAHANAGPHAEFQL